MSITFAYWIVKHNQAYARLELNSTPGKSMYQIYPFENTTLLEPSEPFERV